jgi:uncharacterized protein
MPIKYDQGASKAITAIIKLETMYNFNHEGYFQLGIMIIGALSDTHGHLARSRAAIQILLDKGAELLIHSGDIGHENILIELAALCHPQKIPVYAATGNVDLYDTDIIDFPAGTGVHVARSHTLTLDGQQVGIIHGDDASALNTMIRCGTYHLIFTGHTHIARDEQLANTRVMNPGAVFRAAQPSVAIFDTSKHAMEIVPLIYD